MDKSERNRRMKRCAAEDLDLRLLLDESAWLILSDIHSSSNLPISFLFLSMVVTLCHWANGAMLQGVNYYKIPLVLFGLLCGGSGTFVASWYMTRIRENLIYALLSCTKAKLIRPVCNIEWLDSVRLFRYVTEKGLIELCMMHTKRE